MTDADCLVWLTYRHPDDCAVCVVVMECHGLDD
jgi:hypothetical protein